jgi:dehydrogenase/reductase SDR family protein 1
MFEKGETIEFSGKSIVHLAADPNIMAKTGRILETTDLACEYGFTDVDGTMPICTRAIKDLLMFEGWTKLAAFVPGFIKIPHWLLHMSANKF